MQPLKDKIALVTGSTSGIGLAIAQRLAAAGAHIMLNGMGEASEIEKIRASIANDHSVRVAFNGADLLKPDQIEALVGATRSQLGEIDIVVNNAGIQFVSPIEDFPTAKWDAILGLNLTASFHTSRLVFKGMKDRGFGRIINMASAHGLVASAFKSAYVAAKHGLLGLTKTLALEGAEHGVTANAICPGYVKTPLVEKQIPDTAKARGITEQEVIRDVLLAAQPSKQFVTVEEVAELAYYLCTDYARSINGASLSVDGGWVAQ
jgi:3-hydroxybutyrate dehydrogenase